MTFRDRVDAGRKLAAALEQYRDQNNTIVIALPRGGVVVGAEVARALALPLDIVVPRKIGAPGNEEFAIGAITESGEPVWDRQSVSLTDASEEYLARTVAREQQEAKRRLTTYRGDRPPRNLKDKTIILVDDGIATGLTMAAAIQTIRAEGAARTILAVPVAATDSIAKLHREVDEVVCLSAPQWFGAVGAFYDAFEQTSDEEVVALLRSHP
ncbi:phosphoribosyltransferase [Candidatus Uhrbacteria bacterium]|nr:phosphoribosyltransferase [Candidatus Uhrbacteria bacterium]